MQHIQAVKRNAEHSSVVATVDAVDIVQFEAAANAAAVACQPLHSSYRMKSRFVRTVDMTLLA